MGPSASPAASRFPHPPHAGLLPRSPHQLPSASLLRNSHVDTYSSISHDKFTQLLGRKWNKTCDSVQFSHSVMFSSWRPHGLQHARLPCPSATPRAYSNSCPLSCWCHPTISSSVVPFSSCLQSFPASRSFPMSQFFASGGQSIGVSASASVLPRNIQD